RFPNWQTLGLADATPQIRAAAQQASGRSNPKWQWLERARQERHGALAAQIEAQVYQTAGFRAAVENCPPDGRVVTAAQHAAATVLAVLTRAPAPAPAPSAVTST